MAVRELNGVPPLLELLRSEFPVIQQLSLRTLVIVTTDTDTRATFREEQGFDRLLEFLCNKVCAGHIFIFITYLKVLYL